MSTNRLSLNQPYARQAEVGSTAATIVSAAAGESRYESLNLSGFKIVAIKLQFCASAYGGSFNGGARFDSRYVGPNSNSSNILHTMQSITNTMMVFFSQNWYHQQVQYYNYCKEDTTGSSQVMSGNESETGNSMAVAMSTMIHRPNTLSQLNYYMQTSGTGYHVAPCNYQPNYIHLFELETL